MGKKEEPEQTRLSELEDEISEILGALKMVQRTLNAVSDDDLIESLIYERKALQVRYGYFLRLAREECGSIPATPDLSGVIAVSPKKLLSPPEACEKDVG